MADGVIPRYACLCHVHRVIRPTEYSKNRCLTPIFGFQFEHFCRTWLFPGQLVCLSILQFLYLHIMSEQLFHPSLSRSDIASFPRLSLSKTVPRTFQRYIYMFLGAELLTPNVSFPDTRGGIFHAWGRRLESASVTALQVSNLQYKMRDP